jgi:hypothetical protein
VEDEKVKLDDISAKRRPHKPDVAFGILFGLGTFLGQLCCQLAAYLLGHETFDFFRAIFQGVCVGTGMYLCRRLRPGWFGLE